MSIIQYLQGNITAYLVVSALLGLMVGSFLNVVIHRLPRMLERRWRQDCAELAAEAPPNAATELAGENARSQAEEAGREEESYNLVAPRSQCPECGHAITALENIPVLSYLALRGRCSACGTRISPRYPLVETLTALLTLTVAWHFGFGWQTAGAMVLTWALVALSFIDYDTMLLPDDVTLPFLWLGLAVNLSGLFTPLADAVIGAIAGYGVLWTVYQAFRLLTGKKGMGYGDFKLLAMLGAWMGWQVLPLVVVLSSLVGAVFGIGMILLRRHQRGHPIPFGPYLAVAGWIALLWGQDIMQAYMQWGAGAGSGI